MIINFPGVGYLNKQFQTTMKNEGLHLEHISTTLPLHLRLRDIMDGGGIVRLKGRCSELLWQDSGYF